MCGIIGFIGSNASAKKDLVTKMLLAINHRGPDSSKIFEYGNTIFGFNRLSINDLSENGMQPFKNDLCFVFSNGEIYNHDTLKEKHSLDLNLDSNSDIEIIPHLYKKLGFEFLNELNGGFAIALYDMRAEVLHLILDRFGKKPLYYYKTSDGIYFASELKAFLIAFDNLKIDERAVNWAFFQGYFPYSETPIKGIKKLAPSEILSISNDLSVSSTTWYKMQPDYNFESADETELESAFLNLIDNAVDIRMHADVPAGLYLSGGLDSTTVAKSCSMLGYKDIHTFTGRVSNKDYSTDNVNAIKFARENSFIHHHIDINVDTYRNNIFETSTAFDEINFESANINFIEIVREARKHVTIMLDGCGGDEVFMGYYHQESLHRLPIFFRNSIPNFKLVEKFLAKKNRRWFSLYTALSSVDKYSFQSQSFIPIDLACRMKNFDLENGFDNLDFHIKKIKHSFRDTRELNYLSYLDILGLNMLNYQQLDRCSMYHSIEPRSPLSDFRIWELFYAIDESKKLKKGRKGVMKSLLKSRLPEYILSAKKDGFSNPFYIWFTNNSEFRSEVISAIIKRRDLLIEVLGDEYVNAVLSRWTITSSNDWMDGVRLHQLLVFIIWYYVYFENKSVYKQNLTLSEFISIL